MYTAVDGTVHYKETLRLFKIRAGHSPGFGFSSVAILPQCAESEVKQYSLCTRANTIFIQIYHNQRVIILISIITQNVIVIESMCIKMN